MLVQLYLQSLNPLAWLFQGRATVLLNQVVISVMAWFWWRGIVF